ncbi:restriction endonuclease [Acinetobacter nosocomialis]|uniref:restriction endonuclease n=1 Tax=Acinetobacter nosocomialis TaxID=106654 RepID=UPI0024DEE6FA|nr:restriction endonuclease [Acinetobacter nosocomialis]
MKVSEIVKDWGGFEKLIQDIHQREDLKVQHNVTLTGQSGATRQIDVLLEHSHGPYHYKTLVECKLWNKKVERANIDVLYAGMLDLNASKGVFFTTKGYQKGAEIYAQSKGINIFVVKEVSDEAWGNPGRIINLNLQIIQKAIDTVEPKGTQAVFLKESQKELNLEIHIDSDSQEKHSQILSKHKEKFKTLEELLNFYTEDALAKYQDNPLLINNGEECTRYVRTVLNLKFQEPLEVLKDDVILLIPEIVLTVSLKINQSPLLIDRSNNYLYALSVVDYVNDQSFLVSKLKEAEYPEWQTVKEKNPSDEKLLKNGAILTVGMHGFFDIAETYQLERI